MRFLTASMGLGIALGICVVAMTDGTLAQEPLPPAELHVVGFYESEDGTARIQVQRPGKRVLLVLTGYHSIQWTLEIAPGTEIEKVILAGHEKQTVVGLPEGTEVVSAYYEKNQRRPFGLDSTYEMDSLQFRRFLDSLHECTRREPSSFHGSYRAGDPVVIDAIQRDPRLSRDYPKVHVPKQLEEVEFSAVRSARLGLFRRRPGCYIWPFAAAGPRTDGAQPLPATFRNVVWDEQAEAYYGLAHHGVFRIDPKTGETAEIKPGHGVKRLSWPRGITYDGKRKRLLLLTSHVFSFIYQYLPATDTWSVLTPLDQGLQLDAIALHPLEDQIYVLGGSHGNRGALYLYRFDPDGNILAEVPLTGVPFLSVLLDHSGHRPMVQLVPAGRYLAIVTATARHVPADRGDPLTRVFLVDPQNGNTWHTWRGRQLILDLDQEATIVDASATPNPVSRGLNERCKIKLENLIDNILDLDVRRIRVETDAPGYVRLCIGDWHQDAGSSDHDGSIFAEFVIIHRIVRGDLVRMVKYTREKGGYSEITLQQDVADLRDAIKFSLVSGTYDVGVHVIGTMCGLEVKLEVE